MLDCIRNLRLSVTQWLCVTLAAIVGGLVVMLRIQGSRLHRTQVDLLHKTIQSDQALEDEKLKALRLKFDEALKKYKESK